MSRVIWPLAALLAIAACSGNGPAVISSPDETGGTTDGGTETTTIPTVLKGDLQAIAYDGTTLQVQIAGLDSTPTLVEFDRVASLDVAGYKAYKMQEDALDRMFVALAKISDDGAVTAATVSDGGQFNRHFGGGIFGGTDANSVAGVVYLTEVEDSFDGELEHGTFVLTKCGPDNTSSPCNHVLP